MYKKAISKEIIVKFYSWKIHGDMILIGKYIGNDLCICKVISYVCWSGWWYWSAAGGSKKKNRYKEITLESV